LRSFILYYEFIIIFQWYRRRISLIFEYLLTNLGAAQGEKRYNTRDIINTLIYSTFKDNPFAICHRAYFFAARTFFAAASIAAKWSLRASVKKFWSRQPVVEEDDYYLRLLSVTTTIEYYTLRIKQKDKSAEDDSDSKTVLLLLPIPSIRRDISAGFHPPLASSICSLS
jgi:hypothetical protein